MLKTFILTDHTRWYRHAKKYIEGSERKVEFFCSPCSQDMFNKQIEANEISVIDLKTDFKNLVDYQTGFSLHCKQIFPSALVSNVLCVNIHPGFNPFNRGWYPHVFSTINGMPAGATIHVIDDKIDCGPIIDQVMVDIDAWDTSLTLYEKILNAEFELFDRYFRDVLERKFIARAVVSEGNYNSKNDFRDICELDLKEKMSLKQAIDLLRSLSHPPYRNAFFYTEKGERVNVSIQLEKE